MPLLEGAIQGVLRVRLCGTAARDAVAADLVRRAAGVSGLRARVSACPLHPAADHADLGVHPPSVGGDGPFDVAVGPGDEPTTQRLVCGPLTGGAEDSLGLRLVLLGTRYATALEVTAAALEAASAELSRWRAAVAGWAEHPSKPACAGVQDDLLAALSDDLDTPRALEVFRALVADEGLPPGARFETAVWADRLLGLDLAIDVGRA